MAEGQIQTERADDVQTRPMDPTDPQFHDWVRAGQRAEGERLADVLGGWVEPPAPAPAGEPDASEIGELRLSRPIDGGGDGDGGTSGGGGTGTVTGPAPPLASFFAYRNSRPDVDWNTCGQAAIASMLDFYGRDLGIPKGSNGHWDAGAAIDKVKQDGFGPDVVFGWGTTPGRIRDALQHYGVGASTGSSGLFFSGWPEQWNRLLAYVYYSAIPVPVLIDTGMVGGPAFGAHWPILWKMEYSSSGLGLYFGNWGSSWTSQPVPQDTFLQAWAARALPLGFNHAAVYTGTPRVSF